MKFKMNKNINYADQNIRDVEFKALELKSMYIF